MPNARMMILALVGPLLMGYQGPTRVIQPISAGIWYPADREELRTTVQGYLDAAEAVAPGRRCVACIIPHAPYATAGSIAAAAVRQLEPGQYDRVIVLGAAQHSSFRGCSIPSVQAYRTPLGDVPLDGITVRELSRVPLFDIRSVHYKPKLGRTEVHEIERTIEIVLPYLQVRLGSFRLIPLLVGDFVDFHGRPDENAYAVVVRALKDLMNDRTLIVVSSCFTHFGNNFSYRPFREYIVDGIERLDRTAFDLILERDYPAYRAYLDQTRNTIDGKNAIAILLKLLPRFLEGKLLSYEMSARMTGNTKSSISYAAIAFFEPERLGAQQGE